LVFSLARRPTLRAKIDETVSLEGSRCRYSAARAKAVADVRTILSGRKAVVSHKYICELFKIAN